MVKYCFISAILFGLANLKAQDTTITFSKEEFSKIRFIKQALRGLPAACTIQSYEISMYMVNGVKTKTYTAGRKDEFTGLYIEHAAKNGGELTISKLKTSCVPGTHKTKYTIIVK